MVSVIIIMGSKKDEEYATAVKNIVDEFGINCELRIASGHKTPGKVLDIIDEYKDETVVFITIAGRSNALSGLVDANTTHPVIASPPYSSKFGGSDIFSSLRMPSGVCPMLVLGTEQSALAAIKILSFSDRSIQKKITNYQAQYKKKIEKDDREIKSG